MAMLELKQLPIQIDVESVSKKIGHVASKGSLDFGKRLTKLYKINVKKDKYAKYTVNSDGEYVSGTDLPEEWIANLSQGLKIDEKVKNNGDIYRLQMKLDFQHGRTKGKKIQALSAQYGVGSHGAYGRALTKGPKGRPVWGGAFKGKSIQNHHPSRYERNRKSKHKYKDPNTNKYYQKTLTRDTDYRLPESWNHHGIHLIKRLQKNDENIKKYKDDIYQYCQNRMPSNIFSKNLITSGS